MENKDDDRNISHINEKEEQKMNGFEG